MWRRVPAMGSTSGTVGFCDGRSGSPNKYWTCECAETTDAIEHPTVRSRPSDGEHGDSLRKHREGEDSGESRSIALQLRRTGASLGIRSWMRWDSESAAPHDHGGAARYRKPPDGGGCIGASRSSQRMLAKDAKAFDAGASRQRRGNTWPIRGRSSFLSEMVAIRGAPCPARGRHSVRATIGAVIQSDLFSEASLGSRCGVSKDSTTGRSMLRTVIPQECARGSRRSYVSTAQSRDQGQTGEVTAQAATSFSLCARRGPRGGCRRWGSFSRRRI